jgi:hypothetical protein
MEELCVPLSFLKPLHYGFMFLEYFHLFLPLLELLLELFFLLFGSFCDPYKMAVEVLLGILPFSLDYVAKTILVPVP